MCYEIIFHLALLIMSFIYQVHFGSFAQELCCFNLSLFTTFHYLRTKLESRDAELPDTDKLNANTSEHIRFYFC